MSNVEEEVIDEGEIDCEAAENGEDLIQFRDIDVSNSDDDEMQTEERGAESNSPVQIPQSLSSHMLSTIKENDRATK